MSQPGFGSRHDALQDEIHHKFQLLQQFVPNHGPARRNDTGTEWYAFENTVSLVKLSFNHTRCRFDLGDLLAVSIWAICP